MDDVEDGLKYIIEQGRLIQQKWLFTGSHGGLPFCEDLQNPELYACGVDYVGVSNIFTFMKSIPAYWHLI